MRRIGVVTGSRADYSILAPVLKEIDVASDLALQLFVTGMHLSPEFGLTVQTIESDGFKINDRIQMLISSDTPEAIAKSIGIGTIGFAQAYARTLPDILFLTGDRFEMLSAAVAAMPYCIPIAHLHGGETSQGAFDEAIRHSITKQSHLHFVATETYARRVIQMGEDCNKVFVCGAPSLDNLRLLSLLSIEALEKKIGVTLTPPPLLVTMHPVTLEYHKNEYYIRELLNALKSLNLPVIFTCPNSDTNGRIIQKEIEKYVQGCPNSFMITNLGTQAYFSLMNVALAMVGNSSSGIIEAASFKLPVVNIGNRQQGRVCGDNIIHVDCELESIKSGISRAIMPDFRNKLNNMSNPYGDGYAAKRIVQTLQSIDLQNNILLKKFYDLDFEIK